MKNKICLSALIAFSFFEIAIAQTTLPTTLDVVALPTTFNSTSCTVAGTLFPPPTPYNPTSTAVQLEVNNTATDVCQLFNMNKIMQVMVWDDVTNLSPLTSTVYFSCSIDGSPVSSYTFAPLSGETGGFDPDVAVFSDATGTFAQIVFENNTTGKIDGYTLQWNGSAFVSYSTLPLRMTFSNNPTKKAKNPNIAVPKTGGSGHAIVWHEEGLVNPQPTLTITYSTQPPISYSSTVNLLESKVYISCIDRLGDPITNDLIGSLGLVINRTGNEVIRTGPATSYHLFDRNFNPDVSFSEERLENTGQIYQRGISVVFLSEWFDPSNFSIVTGQLSVAQGTDTNYHLTTPINVQTSTYNFTTLYKGKPRIAARLSYTAGINMGKDFSVVMGQTLTTLVPCGGGTYQQTSNIHNWWYQGGGIVCPAVGVDLLAGTSYASGTAFNPVISCINGLGHYNVTFSAINSTTNGFDIMAKTYKEGAPISTTTLFSLVNRGPCNTSSYLGNQVIPSVASVRKSGSALNEYACTNYFFWSHTTRSLNFKRASNNIVPGSGAALRQIDDNLEETNNSEFIAYPNPTQSEVIFDFKLVENEKPMEIEIFDILGQSIDKFSIQEDAKEYKKDIEKIPSGIYIAVLKTNNQDYSIEFVKK